jgi:hypothetical protein
MSSGSSRLESPARPPRCPSVFVLIVASHRPGVQLKLIFDCTHTVYLKCNILCECPHLGSRHCPGKPYPAIVDLNLHVPGIDRPMIRETRTRSFLPHEEQRIARHGSLGRNPGCHQSDK